MITITKTVYEKFGCYIDFANLLQAGETLTLGSVKATDVYTGADVSSTVIAATPAPGISGTKVTFWVQAGTAGHTYAISAQVTASGGEALEGDLGLEVASYN